MIPRRTFLGQLAGLPFVGGSIALIGQPSAVAAPVTPSLLEAYKTFLDHERRALAWEMAGDPVFIARYGFDPARGSRVDRCKSVNAVIFGGLVPTTPALSEPSSRAALVLSAVGQDWRDR